jgi:hypothetical protein
LSHHTLVPPVAITLAYAYRPIAYDGSMLCATRSSSKVR